MASEGLLAALAANWDDDGSGARLGPVTLKSLAADLKAWMNGSAGTGLAQALEQLRQQVAEAARATELDLKPELAPELEAPLRATLEIYEDLEPVLEALGTAHAAGNRSVKNLCGYLESSRTELLAQDQAMQAWLRAPVLRCPRCGARPQDGERNCLRCRVEMLYPDAESALSDGQSSAQLGPQYLAVLEALQLVVGGEAPLSRLMAALTELEQVLSDWAEGAEDEESSNGQLTYALDTLAEAARLSLEGTAQMRSVVQTRQTRDLNEGWQIVFNAAQAIRDVVPMIAKATGAAPEDPFPRCTDSITIEGD